MNIPQTFSKKKKNHNNPPLLSFLSHSLSLSRSLLSLSSVVLWWGEKPQGAVCGSVVFFASFHFLIKKKKIFFFGEVVLGEGEQGGPKRSRTTHAVVKGEKREGNHLHYFFDERCFFNLRGFVNFCFPS